MFNDVLSIYKLSIVSQNVIEDFVPYHFCPYKFSPFYKRHLYKRKLLKLLNSIIKTLTIAYLLYKSVNTFKTFIFKHFFGLSAHEFITFFCYRC